jgi:hypothetical protein
MMMDDDDRNEFESSQYREFERVQEFLTPRLDRAERLYTQAVNGLWLSNAGGALATLTFVGATWQSGACYRHWLMVPLCFFLFGLLSMGLGTGIFLVSESRIIKRMESIRSINKLRLDEITSQSEEIGLLWNWRNYAAIVSAGTLILGILAGVVILFAK